MHKEVPEAPNLEVRMGSVSVSKKVPGLQRLASLLGVLAVMGACGGGFGIRNSPSRNQVQNVRPQDPNPLVSQILWSYRIVSRNFMKAQARTSDLEVELCTSEQRPFELKPERIELLSALRGSPRVVCAMGSLCDGQAMGERPPVVTDDGISVVPVGGQTCLRYRLSVARMVQAGWIPRAWPSALLIPTYTWLWKPSVLDRTAKNAVRLSTEDPFLLLPDHQGTGALFRFLSYTVLGTHHATSHISGENLLERIVQVPKANHDDQTLLRWSSRVGHLARKLPGFIPPEDLTWLWVEPSTTPSVQANEPFGFGMATRGGNPTILLYARPGFTANAMAGHWVPIHELMHFLTPLVQPEGTWLTEGIATYYQILLRARGGVITTQQALQELHHGLSAGTRGGTGRTLRQESADMRQTRAYQRVYWSGTAFMWLADLQLRRLHSASLDEVLVQLQSSYPNPQRRWGAGQLLAMLDRISQTSTFTGLWSTWADQSGFPDTKSAFQSLAVERSATEIHIDPCTSERENQCQLRRALFGNAMEVDSL